MIQYKSYIHITIRNQNKSRQEAIDLAIEVFGLVLEDTAEAYSESQQTVLVTTIGTPESELPRIAKAIWWANEAYCEVEFLVEESQLSYSSPSIFSELDYKILNNDCLL